MTYRKCATAEVVMSCRGRRRLDCLEVDPSVLRIGCGRRLLRVVHEEWDAARCAASQTFLPLRHLLYDRVVVILGQVGATVEL